MQLLNATVAMAGMATLPAGVGMAVSAKCDNVGVAVPVMIQMKDLNHGEELVCYENKAGVAKKIVEVRPSPAKAARTK